MGIIGQIIYRNNPLISLHMSNLEKPLEKFPQCKNQVYKFKPIENSVKIDKIRDFKRDFNGPLQKFI